MLRDSTQFKIDLNLFASNYENLKTIAPGKETLLMVKANAYGHGMIEMSNFSQNELAIKEFGCATLGEAIKLRKSIGPDSLIYVFSEHNIKKDNLKENFRELKIIPVLSSIDDLTYFLKDPVFKHVPLVLKVNTGMNRLGLDKKEVELAAKLLNNNKRSIFHLMTHFANAALSMKHNKRSLQQQDEFKEIKDIFKNESVEVQRTSISNSGAIGQLVGLEESHIRPGLMMYGPSALVNSDSSKWPVQVISTLECEILDLFKIQKGTPIGYGSQVCPENGTLAILSIGYGDGFHTSYQGAVIGTDHKGKIVGRVSMDMTYILLDNNCNLKKGDLFQIWNQGQEQIQSLCSASKMVPYEILTSVNERVHRKYSFKA